MNANEIAAAITAAKDAQRALIGTDAWDVAQSEIVALEDKAYDLSRDPATFTYSRCF